MFVEKFASVAALNRRVLKNKMKHFGESSLIGAGLGATLSAVNSSTMNKDKDFKTKMKNIGKAALVGAIGAPVMNVVGLAPYSKRSAQKILKAEGKYKRAAKAASPGNLSMDMLINGPKAKQKAMKNLHEAERELHKSTRGPETRRRVAGAFAGLGATIGLSKAMED